MNTQQILDRYLGGQSVTEFAELHGDVRTYARKVFAGEIFGPENPAAPDLGINDQYDLTAALIQAGLKEGAFRDSLGTLAKYNDTWADSMRRRDTFRSMSDDELLAYPLTQDEEERADYIYELGQRLHIPTRPTQHGQRYPTDMNEAARWKREDHELDIDE